MKLMFIGADHEVTGSCHYVEACGKRFLVDYGMEQGKNVYENAELPVNPSEIDFVLLTHAHIDHSGLLPLESVDVYILFSLFASFLTFVANRLDSVQIILLHIAECALFIFTIFSSGMVHRFLMGYSASIQ